MIRKIFGIGLVFIIILLLNSPIKENPVIPDIPIAIGKLLNPFSGYSALINSDKLPDGIITSSNFIDTINVKWDELRIPHIQAKNELDLYFMQGYVIAFERLWQMEFQTHAAAGRISEIIGEKGLDHDRLQRRRGMLYAAKNTLAEIEKDTSLYALLESFTNGINFYINSLDKNKYPIEYKILDYAPELWTPLKTSLLLKSMAWGLTERDKEDLAYTKILNEFGLEVIEELFPIFPLNHDPIIPKNTKFDFAPSIKNKPETIYKSRNHTAYTIDADNSSLGSNNWVLNSRRTKNKVPILSNDPHLSLRLPSLWYLMHLQCPTMNVMGVTIPGAPGIIIGFNDDISWGVTNGADDSMDWYDITFYDTKKNEYYYDNQWISTNKIIEEIQIKGEYTFYDTITYTHHGPVVWDYSYYQKDLITIKEKSGLALQWTAHNGTNEILSFYLLNKASNYDEFKQSLRTYDCPGQNFIYSDIHGNIAIFHAGKNPVKWTRQGMFVSDGSNSDYNWDTYIPFGHKASIKNPLRGYLSSANQNPVDADYPYYLGGDFETSYRATQINIQLDTLYKATIDDMIDIQLDNTSLIAKNILPALLTSIDIKEDSTGVMADWITILKNWNYKYDKELIAPTFFENWINEIEKNTWSNSLGNFDSKYTWPNINKLEELITTDPNSKWFDNKNTDNVEALYDICNNSFNKTIENLSNKSIIDSAKLQWGNYRGTDIIHIANIPTFSSLNLKTDGAENIINATRKNEGPSWRYIIEMKKPYKIKGIYPGGQSGYPGSIYYDNFVQDWVYGKYYDLIFPTNNEFTGTELQCIPIHCFQNKDKNMMQRHHLMY